jgi:hypothetical protein
MARIGAPKTPRGRPPLRSGRTKGRTPGTGKQKTTIRVERRKIDEARRLTGVASTSAAIDLALDRGPAARRSVAR